MNCLSRRFQPLENDPVLISKPWKKTGLFFQTLETRTVWFSKVWKRLVGGTRSCASGLCRKCLRTRGSASLQGEAKWLVRIGLLLLLATPAQGQVGVDQVTGWIDRWQEEYELDLDALPFEMPTPEDWRHFWGLVNHALEAESLEELVWLRPYAELALGVLESQPAGEGYASWLRQRMDYFWAAEEEMRAAPPTPRPGPPPPPPPVVRPKVIRPPSPPPPRPPTPAPTPPAKSTSTDFETWKARMEKRSAPARAAALVPQLRPIFREEGVPEGLVWLAEVESSFNPEARSPVGALGLYQFMPATAERFGMSLKPRDERVIPEKSARAAAQYLKFLQGRFQSWPLALAAYNAGEGRVGRLLRTHEATTFEGIAAHLPSETRMYVPKVRAVVMVREGQDLAGW